ncbi:MAG: response regulator [Rhodospirillaceae bacterium]
MTKTSEPHCSGPPSAPTILVVEDNAIFRTLISSFLKQEGWTAFFAKDGREALAAASLHRPDVIVMDIEMPVMNGLEATRCIRDLAGRFAEVPIVGFSNMDEPDNELSCSSAGMDTLVSKASGVPVLIAVVRKYLHGRTGGFISVRDMMNGAADVT